MKLNLLLSLPFVIWFLLILLETVFSVYVTAPQYYLSVHWYLLNIARWYIGLLAIFATPFLLFRLFVTWMENNGRFGLGSWMLKKYRTEPVDDGQKARVDWSRWIDDHIFWIAGAAIMYGLFFPVLETFPPKNYMPDPTNRPPWFGAVLAIFVVFALSTKVACWGGLMLLLSALARLVRERPRIWVGIAIAWASTGLVLMASAAVFGKTLQALVNTSSTRRMDPDNFREIIVHNPPEGFDPLSILSFPEVLDGYTWTRMLITEAFALCAIAIWGALVLRHVAIKDWRYPGLAVSAAIAFLMFFYVFFVAPWSLIIDYDNFIGDNLLGSISMDIAFFIFSFDEVAASVFSVYAVLVAAQIILTRRRSSN